MRQNQFQYFIGVGLPKKEDYFFIFLKKQFHPENNLSSPAHITIVPPFFYRNEKLLLEKLKFFGEKQSSFNTIFKQIDSFRQSKYGTVYLAPNDGHKFLDIFTGIHEIFPHLPRKRVDRFVPHLTIANRVPLDKIDLVKNQLSLMQICLDLEVKSVNLYRRRFNESWQKFSEIKFLGN